MPSTIPTCFAFRIWKKIKFSSSSTSAKAHFTILWCGEVLPTHRTRSPQRCQHCVQGIGTGVCHQFLLELPVEPTESSHEILIEDCWASCQSMGFLETFLYLEGFAAHRLFSQARSFWKVNFYKVFQPTLRRRKGSCLNSMVCLQCNWQIKRKVDPT